MWWPLFALGCVPMPHSVGPAHNVAWYARLLHNRAMHVCGDACAGDSTATVNASGSARQQHSTHPNEIRESLIQ